MKVRYEVGDAISGDKILCEARKISKPKVIVATGRHKARRITIWENAYAVIERKTRFHPKK